MRGLDHVFGLGNVLTGKGNIKREPQSSAEISKQVLRYLGLEGEFSLESAHADARKAAGTYPECSHRCASGLTPQAIRRIHGEVQALWRKNGYTGDYAAWLARVRTRGEEQ